jgi:hypothetical protein
MTIRKGKGRTPLPPGIFIYPDSIRQPPALPDARSVLDMGLDLTEQECLFQNIRCVGLHFSE